MRWQNDLSSVAMLPSSHDIARMKSRFDTLIHESLITLLNDDTDLLAAQSCVRLLKKRSDVTMVMGTGGASLGAQALLGVADMKRARSAHRVEFIDNIDPETFSHAFSGRDLTRMSFLLISKSGETVETLAAALSVITLYREAGLLPDLSERLVVITGAQDSSLRQIAIQYGLPCFTHPDIGGRYSVFTIVGLLPALLAGVDIPALKQGATQWIVSLKAAMEHAPYEHTVLRSACWLAHSRKAHPIHVIMPYADSLRAYTRWFQQLWAESLGKNQDGSTPFAAIGALDQHSQLQLFLDGPKDKNFTFVLPKRGQCGTKLSTYGIKALDFIHGATMGDVMDASAEATIATLRTHGTTLRVLRTDTLDMFALGELLMMHMVETIFVAALMGVDPFDQPAVEEGKTLTRHYLRLRQA